jgi:hypothetical protein
LATKRKSSKSKKDLEAKIAQLESKLQKLSSQVAQKPAGQAKTAPPPPKPAEASKPTEAPTPKPAPQQQAAPPVTRETLIERTTVGVWHDRKTRTPAYVSENPRAWARRHAEGADCPTTPWGLQKSKITGYTAPSNKYFATRQRLAYHPPETSFTGYGISLGHGASQSQAQAAPPPPPPAQDRTVPKESGTSGGGSSKKQSLEEYERDYLARLDQQDREDHEFHRAAEELAAKRRAESSSSSSSGSSARGSLPKGF